MSLLQTINNHQKPPVVDDRSATGGFVTPGTVVRKTLATEAFKQTGQKHICACKTAHHKDQQADALKNI